MSCYLKSCCIKRFYWIWFNCTNWIQQAVQLFFIILNLFRASFIWMKLTCVWYIFRFISKFVLPCLFFELWLSLLLNMQNNENNYKGAKREWWKKKKVNSKKIRGHLFMWFASLKFGPPSLNSFANIKFWSEITLILNVVNWHSIWHSEFSSKTLKIRSKWDRPAFFFCTTFIILISMIKLEAKRTDFHQIDICERLVYLQCLHYRTATQL